MAKLSLIEREKKRAHLVAKYAKKYAELKAAANDAKKSDEERYASRLELQKLPRNAYPTRQRNRCGITGRPRGTFRKFGLARNKIRELAFKGDIPGIIHASWRPAAPTLSAFAAPRGGHRPAWERPGAGRRSQWIRP